MRPAIISFLYTAFGATILWLGFASAALSFDQSMVGSWKTSVTKPDGIWEIQWDIDAAGTYRAIIRGPRAVLGDAGQLNAERGRWAKRSRLGAADGGTYQFSGPDKMTMVGKLGPSLWIRVPAANALAPKLPGAPAATAATATAAATSPEHKPGKSALNLPITENDGPAASGTNSGTSFFSHARGVKRTQDAGSATGDLPADAKTLLLSDFPLPAAADEVEQFGIPGLNLSAASGMKARQFRMVR